MKKQITQNKLLVFMLACLGITHAQYQDTAKKSEPFPSNPVGMQTYINNTTPNVAILFDNSRTMRFKMKARTMSTRVSRDNRPRRVDIVKDAALAMVQRYHNTLNISYANLTDYSRDLHWSSPGTLNFTRANAGYDFSPYFRFYLPTTMETYGRNTYRERPFSSLLTGRQKQRTPGTGRGSLNQDSSYSSAFYNNIGRSFVGNSPIAEEAVPYTTYTPGRLTRRKIGKSLLVPHQNIYTPAYNTQAKTHHLNALTRAIRTTGLRLAFLKYIYPNYVEYMASKIQYRCQNTYMMVITDGNNLTSLANRRAARKYFSVNKTPDVRRRVGLRPKPSTERDGDGFFYNGPDFSEQNIRSFAIGIGTNPRKFRRFEQYGGGKAAVAVDAEDVLDIMEEFMQEMHPSNTFSMTSPTGSFLYTDESSSMLVANINTETRGWIGELRFTKDFTESVTDDENDQDHGHETAQYLPNYAVVAASTNKGLLNLSNVSDRNLLSHKDLNLNTSIPVDNYLKWLTGYTEIESVTIEDEDDNTEETFDIYKGDNQTIFAGLRSRAFEGLDERRYLGDVLSSSLEMVGALNNTIKAPEYLTVGSNDGMFKIYKANPDYGKFLEKVTIPIYDEDADDDLLGRDPEIIGYEHIDIYDTHPYTYSFAYLPGTAEKNNGFNVLQSLAFRAVSNYGTAPTPLHQYTVNGEVAFRTTPKGHTFLVGGLGQGGKGAFALNIAGTDEITGRPVGLSLPKDDWAKNVPLWDTSSKHFGHAAKDNKGLGYILGKPVIGRVALTRNNSIPNLKNDVRYAAVLPAGTYGDQDAEAGPTVYIYDALGVDVSMENRNNVKRTPGKLIQKITYELSKEEKAKFKYRNSLSATTMIDLDQDGVMDIGYVGDLNGNLYRIDLRGTEPSQWTLDLIFEGDASHPIVQAPSLSRFFQRSMIVFGTGSLMHTEFSDEQYKQVLYGLMENQNFTAHKNNPVKNDDKRFIEQSISRRGNQATISDKRPPLNGFVGWKLPIGQNMKAGSEAIVQKPIIFNGTVFIQTFTYRDNQELAWRDPTTGEMKSLMCFKSLDTAETWLYQINALTGGALDSNSSYLQQLGATSSGTKTEGLMDRPVKLVEANKSPSMTTDGEIISGNDKDIDLNPELSSNDDFDIDDDKYITGEGCKAMLTNGMEIVCPTTVHNPYQTKLRPGRISIINLL